MANTNVYINLVSGAPVLQDARGGAIGEITLEYGDTMTIYPGSGFGDSPSISKVEIFAWSDGAKGASLGSWTGGTTSVDVLSLAASGSTVVVTDDDRGAADADFGYSVSATVTKGGVSQTYTADPELLAKKRQGGTRAFESRVRPPRPPEAGA